MLKQNAFRFACRIYLMVCGFFVVIPHSVFAQSVPGSADVGRIDPFERQNVPERRDQPSLIPEIRSNATIPEGASGVNLTISDIQIEGASAFSKEALSDIYEPYLNRDITLDVLWVMAERITERYRNAGYFLSRAFVPAQEIDKGSVTIRVVEGYVGDVVLDDAIGEHRIVKQLIARLTSLRPITANMLESTLLRLNDLPGVSFRAVVEPGAQDTPGAVTVLLKPSDEAGEGSVEINNYGSRFLGPVQAVASYKTALVPLQQTTVTALSSLPTDELSYLALQHQVPLYPGIELAFSGSYVTSEPGATLSANNIESDSTILGIGASYRAIRQRQENLTFSLKFDGRNTNGDILTNTPLTRDRIRALRLGFDYDTSDQLQGYNYLSARLNQGLDILGSSNAGDLNLSRAQAEPEFTTLYASYSRVQSLGSTLQLIGQAAGQVASDPLFSAEEFGYGGQSFGRAYDASEITGDHGLAGSLELRYLGLDSWQDTRFIPYGFYDVGRVWNEDSNSQPISAASAGFGVRWMHAIGLSGNAGLAFPLTKRADTHMFGDGTEPRLLLEFGLAF